VKKIHAIEFLFFTVFSDTPRNVILERELIRLRDESNKRKYDLQEMFTTQTTFDKIQFMQPIRQWLAKNINEQQEVNDTVSDLLENYEELLFKKTSMEKTI
jgi:hypothetical protein